MPTVSHKSASVTTRLSSRILVTCAALCRSCSFSCVFSSLEYHVNPSSALDLQGNKTIWLVGEKETDLALGILGCGSSALTIPAEQTISSSGATLLLNQECRRCSLGLATGKSTIKLPAPTSPMAKISVGVEECMTAYAGTYYDETGTRLRRRISYRPKSIQVGAAPSRNLRLTISTTCDWILSSSQIESRRRGFAKLKTKGQNASGILRNDCVG